MGAGNQTDRSRAMMNMKQKLIHAATRYDARQESAAKRSKRGRGYNHYALAQYFMRIDVAMARIDAGENARLVLVNCFNDRLRDCLLKAIGENTVTKAEYDSGFAR